MCIIDIKRNDFNNSGGWTPSVNADIQETFINTTINSKFALVPNK